MDFEDVLVDVGDSGKYQQRLILYYLLITACFPGLVFNLFFFVSVPDHWCYVSEVAKSNLTIEQQRSLVSPSSDPECQMFDVNYTEILNTWNFSEVNNSRTKSCVNGWDYDKTNYDYTAATQWNMYCENNYYPTLIWTLNSVGSIIGTPVYGFFSDRFGRRKAYLCVILVTTITAIASVLTTDFTAFIVLKAINGSLMPCIFQVPYIIVVELVAPEVRTRMNGLSNIFWAIGILFLPLEAYLTRNWITLGLMNTSVMVFAFLYYVSLPESPRWLVSQKRYEEAQDILQNIAEVNGKKADPEQILSKLKILGEKMKEQGTDLKTSPLDLVKYPRLRKMFIIISVCWTANVASFYGLQLNVSNLAGNEFLNFFLTTLPEIPGYIASWIFMSKIGRRWCTVAGFSMTAIACIMPAFFSEYSNAGLICSMLGKFSASATFMATYQQSSELYPTVLRSLGMGMSGTIAAVITIFVPYLIYLSMYGKSIPFLVLGFGAIIAAILSSFLPESLNENLPQTVLDTEEFGKNQKYFSWTRRKMSVSRERAASLAVQSKEMDSVNTDEEEKQIYTIYL